MGGISKSSALGWDFKDLRGNGNLSGWDMLLGGLLGGISKSWKAARYDLAQICAYCKYPPPSSWGALAAPPAPPRA